MVEQYEGGQLHCANPEIWFDDEEEAKAYVEETIKEDCFKYEPCVYVIEVERGGESEHTEVSEFHKQQLKAAFDDGFQQGWDAALARLFDKVFETIIHKVDKPKGD
jgi:hypothetical protein